MQATEQKKQNDAQLFTFNDESSIKAHHIWWCNHNQFLGSVNSLLKIYAT